jgi:hypothetical protein
VAYEIDTGATWRALLRQPSFWITLVVQLLTVMQRHAVIATDGHVGNAASALLDLASVYGFVALAQWQPPRRPWTNAERLARGLDPLPDPPAPPASVAVGGAVPPPIPQAAGGPSRAE